jgi:hypothetical protein
MNFKNFALLGMVCILVVSCVKPKTDDPVPAPVPTPTPTPTPETPTQKYGNGVIHLHTFVGEEEIIQYDDEGHKGERGISMNFANMFLCQFELVDMRDSVVKMSDSLLVKTPEAISYYLSKIPVGKYKSIRFKVGIDSTAKMPNKKPYSVVTPLLFHIAGKLDTSTVPDLDKNVRVPYSYKLNGIQKYIEVRLPVRRSGAEFQIVESKIRYEYFHIYMDLETLFSGIKINDPQNLQLNESFDANSSLGNRIKNNISNMFRYE